MSAWYVNLRNQYLNYEPQARYSYVLLWTDTTIFREKLSQKTSGLTKESKRLYLIVSSIMMNIDGNFLPNNHRLRDFDIL